MIDIRNLIIQLHQSHLLIDQTMYQICKADLIDLDVYVYENYGTQKARVFGFPRSSTMLQALKITTMCFVPVIY